MSLTALRRVMLLGLTVGWLVTQTACDGCGGLHTTVVKCKVGDCCKKDEDCVSLKKVQKDPDPANWFCKEEIQTCLPLQKTCTDDGQCCPGQTCSTTIGLCVDTYTQCTVAVDGGSGDESACPVKGQYCEPMLGLFPSGAGCTFTKCQTTTDCAQGLSCFNSYCVGEPPCRGGCPGGAVCTPVNNMCFQLDSPSASCSQTCTPGTILVFEDGQNTFNECNPAEKDSCTCLPLPPILSGDLVRFNDATLANGKLLVSAYDGDFGDLVLRTYDKGTLAQTSLEYIDGVPSTGAVTGDPKGPRAGRADKGPDVGRYTSLAYDASSDTTHIAYYGVTDGTSATGDLKYAWRVGTGAWTILTVDGADSGGVNTADTGLYTSLVLAADGAPVISYFQKFGVGTRAGTSALKIARGKTAQPASAADFIISTIETEGVTALPCAENPCGTGQLCVQQTGMANGVCVANSSACHPACASTEVCGVSAGAPACLTALAGPALADLPDGDGLFSKVAYLDGKLVVVWYDHKLGQLKGLITQRDSPTQGVAFNANEIKVLDDGARPGAAAAHDVGRFVSLAIADGASGAPHRIALAYLDQTAHQLNVLTADAGWANVTPVDKRIVDTGAGTPTGDTQLFVGADTSIRFVGPLLSILYQNQTGGDLRLATQTAAGTPASYTTTIIDKGAAGFYSHLLVDSDNSRYTTTAVLKATKTGSSTVGTQNRLNVTKVP
jgi:hypothetical protein